MASEFPSQSKRRKTTQHTCSSETKTNLHISLTNSFCEAFHKKMWPYYSRTNCQEVRDACLTTLKASSTASSGVPPNCTDRLHLYIITSEHNINTVCR